MLDPDFPTTLPAFQARFNDEEACAEYLRSKKWPEGFRCPRCGHGESHSLHTRRLEQCTACRHQTSLTTDTMFHNTQKPLSLWFRAIFEFVSRKHGCNSMDLERLLGLSRQTAFNWLHKIRDAMVSPTQTQLKGRVEVDETHIGGPEQGVLGRDRGSKKHLIVGAVEVVGRACGRLRLAPADSGSAADLQTWVADVIKEGEEIHTDGWQGYEGLDNVYRHDVEVIGDPKTASQKFPCIHRAFSLFKRVILSTYQGSISAKYLWAYCQEFVFRFNRRKSRSRTLLVQRVLENAVLRAPSPDLFTGPPAYSSAGQAG